MCRKSHREARSNLERLVIQPRPPSSPVIQRDLGGPQRDNLNQFRSNEMSSLARCILLGALGLDQQMQIFVKDGLQVVARRMRQNQSPVIDRRVFLEKRSGLRLVVETSKSERDRHSSAQEFGIVKIKLRANSRKRTQRACRGRTEIGRAHV